MLTTAGHGMQRCNVTKGPCPYRCAWNVRGQCRYGANHCRVQDAGLQEGISGLQTGYLLKAAEKQRQQLSSCTGEHWSVQQQLGKPQCAQGTPEGNHARLGSAPETRARPFHKPNMAPPSRLREMVPGMANVCIPTYTSANSRAMCTCGRTKQAIEGKQDCLSQALERQVCRAR